MQIPRPFCEIFFFFYNTMQIYIYIYFFLDQPDIPGLQLKDMPANSFQTLFRHQSA